MNLRDEEQEVLQLSQSHRRLTDQVEEETFELEASRAKLVATQNAQELLQLVSKAVQEQAHRQIAEVVSSCLRTVFDDPYEFAIKFEQKRGKTEASLRFVRRGLDVDPLTASGGGMIDVAAFALRVSCLMLHRPALSRVVVIDEGFKFVSAKYRDNVRLMLEGLAKDLGLQIVQVTHIKELETGKVIEL